MIVRAPATSANLGPGFDCAAVALDLWNELEVTDGEGVVVEGEGAGELPEDATNLGVRAYALLAPTAGKRFRFLNRIPLERGLGSSAAAIALGLAAAAPDEPRRGAARGSGSQLEAHADNLAAALGGGVTLTWRRADRTHRRRAAARADRRRARDANVAPLSARGRAARDGPPRRRRRTRAGRAALLGAALAARRRRAVRGRASTTGCTSPTARRPLLDELRADPPDGSAGATLSGSGPTVIVWARGCRRLRRRARGRFPRARDPPACRRSHGAAGQELVCDDPARRLPPARGYLAGHVPGAVHLDPEHDLTGEIGDASRGRHPLARGRRLRGRRYAAPASARASSRSPTTTAPAGRRAAGGCCGTSVTTRRAASTCAATPARWNRARGLSPNTSRAFAARPRDDDTIEAEELLERLDDRRLLVLDARSRARWRGDEEPLDPVAGRIPGARNAFFEEPLPDGAVERREVAVYCGSGVTAAVQVQRLVLAGREDARLYPGSFSEWCRREGYPIERGDQ